jgi:esterase/lipase superfamily enzyme
MRRPLRSLPIVVAMLAALLAGCTRPPDLIGIDNPATPAESVPDISRHRIYIITTRATSGVAGQLFSAARAETLGLASVDVTVPPNHVTGELERPTRLPPDPRTEFAVVDPLIYANDAAFVAALDRELAQRPPGERRILLFVHGYNNTTSDAVLRLTQFVEDTGFQGVPILFSWASAASVTRYVYDLNSALIARGRSRRCRTS